MSTAAKRTRKEGRRRRYGSEQNDVDGLVVSSAHAHKTRPMRRRVVLTTVSAGLPKRETRGVVLEP